MDLDRRKKKRYLAYVGMEQLSKIRLQQNFPKEGEEK